MSTGKIIENADGIFSVIKAAENACVLLGEIEDAEDDIEKQRDRQRDLIDFIDEFVSQPSHSGSADDFHNFGCKLAKKNEYRLACKVLKCGMETYATNVDLLADYIEYGMSTDLVGDLDAYVQRLKAIPHCLWTWRGYSFLINYLIHLADQSVSDEEISALMEEMNVLLANFKKYFPFGEEPFVAEAAIYKAVHDVNKELEVLRYAVNEAEIVCPKCALRLADTLFDRGQYKEASEAVKKAMLFSIQTQSSVREGYLYYLYALCRVALLQRDVLNVGAAPSEDMEKIVEDIYSNFELSLPDLSREPAYYDVIGAKALWIEQKTGIEIEKDVYKALRDCVDDYSDR